MGTKELKSGGRENRLSAIYNSKYFFGAAAFIVFSLWLGYYVLTGQLQTGNEYYISQYLFTYDHGYVSRGFIGEVLSWFVDIVTPKIIRLTSAIISGVFIVSASITVGYVMNRAKEDKKIFNKVITLVFILIIFNCGPAFYFITSHFDKLIWAVTFLAVLCTENKKTIWLCPLLCVFAIVINPSFLVGSMLLIAVVLLQKVCESGFDRNMTAVCAVSYILILAMAFFATISEHHLGFETPSEMFDYYYSRYSGTVDDVSREFVEQNGFVTYFNSIFEVKKAVGIMFSIVKGDLQAIVTPIFTLIIPFFTLAACFWRKAIKLEDNKLQKFVFGICAAVPAVDVVFIVFGWEVSRYFSFAVFVQLCLVIYYLIHGNTSVIKAVDSFVDFGKKHPAIIIPIGVYFAFLIKVVI